MKFSRIKMLKTSAGAADGVNSQVYEEGSIYDVPPRLAELFKNSGKCIVASRIERHEFEDFEEAPAVAVEPSKDKESETTIKPSIVADAKPSKVKEADETVVVADPPPEPKKPSKPKRKGRSFSVEVAEKDSPNDDEQQAV